MLVGMRQSKMRRAPSQIPQLLGQAMGQVSTPITLAKEAHSHISPIVKHWLGQSYDVAMFQIDQVGIQEEQVCRASGLPPAQNRLAFAAIDFVA